MGRRAGAVMSRPSWRMRTIQRALILSSGLARKPKLSFVRRVTGLLEKLVRLPAGVDERVDMIAGVPVRRLAPSGSSPTAVVLHIHGGAYVSGSSRAARAHARLCVDAGLEVISVDYRLAPEAPFPAALEDTIAVYAALRDRPLVVMGESAGGGLAMSTLQLARRRGLPMPQALVAIFPWADLTQTSRSFEVNAGRDVLSRSGLTANAHHYAGDVPLDDPQLSPLRGSFEGFPSTMVVVGTSDSLLDDARAAVSRLRAADVDTTYVEVEGGIHGFIALPTPEGARSMAQVHGFVATIAIGRSER